MTLPIEVAPSVARLPIGFVNTYFVGAIGGPWTLVDTGLPGFAGYIQEAARQRYGAGARPEAIILTHGHIDHVSNAKQLAKIWNVPVYAHRLEMPYLTGASSYPPNDPTVGGFLALLARVMPRKGVDLGSYIHELPGDRSLPGMPDWRWEHTPGHSPGHISLFRAADKTLIVGDAFTTLDMDSLQNFISQAQIISRPPTPVTCDWQAAEFSVDHLAELQPMTIACGHGIPMSGPEVAEKLSRFAEYFPMPPHGRYVPEPAKTNLEGIVSVPVRAADPLGKVIAIAGLLVLASALAAVTLSRRSSSNTEEE